MITTAKVFDDFSPSREALTAFLEEEGTGRNKIRDNCNAAAALIEQL